MPPDRAPIDLEHQRWTLNSRLLVTACVVLVGGAWWVRDGAEQVTNRITRIEITVERMADDIRRQTSAMDSALLRRELQSWLQTLRAANPSMVIPELPPR